MITKNLEIFIRKCLVLLCVCVMCIILYFSIKILKLSDVCLSPLGPSQYGIFEANANTDIREQENSDI